MENKSELTIAEIDDIYQSMSAAELWQRGKGVAPLQVKYIELDEESDFIQLPSKTYSVAEKEPPQLAEGIKPVYGNKSKRISKKEIAQIAGLPYDEMYRKHEQGRWAKDDTPLVFEILGKPIVLNPFLENDNFELISAALSPDEQYMFILLRDLNSQFTYTANAKWHEATGIYVTMVYHSNYIADWDKCTTTFEEKISWF
jgi:hypothetical protein